MGAAEQMNPFASRRLYRSMEATMATGEQVLGNVPPAARCRCRETMAKDAEPGRKDERRAWLREFLSK